MHSFAICGLKAQRGLEALLTHLSVQADYGSPRSGRHARQPGAWGQGRPPLVRVLENCKAPDHLARGLQPITALRRMYPPGFTHDWCNWLPMPQLAPAIAYACLVTRVSVAWRKRACSAPSSSTQPFMRAIMRSLIKVPNGTQFLIPYAEAEANIYR